MVQMSRDELRDVIHKEVEAVAFARAAECAVERHVVDRAYLMRNLKWSRRQIEDLERENRLRPVFTGDGRAHHYTLGDCLRIAREL